MRHPVALVFVAVLVLAVGWSLWRTSSGDDVAEPSLSVTPAAADPPAPADDALPPGPTPSAPPPPAPAVDAGKLLAQACAGQLAVSDAGTLPVDLDEVSGLAASRRHVGVLWAIEDSLNDAALFGLALDGTVRAAIEVDGLNFDWEDLALGPGLDGTPWLYIADFGDNFGVRNRIVLLAMPEPDLDDTEIGPEEIRLRYEGGPTDAEALVVNRSGIWVFAKVVDGSPTPLFHAPHGATVLQQVATIDVGAESVTAADLSADGTLLAVRTYDRLLVYAVADDDIAQAVSTSACALPPPAERQGEAVAVLADATGLVTVQEAAQATLHLFTLG